MTVKQILFPVIKQEMKKYRDNGQRLRLKTAIRKKDIRGYKRGLEKWKGIYDIITFISSKMCTV